ncbi:host attachment protein [Kordiimonas marina]|uniref:host attachment protein n=1 Tax=Kordiimonas marina TaxID=2872312 RepID=UPI001FF61EB9|nr:host attachment protein [Kordiimonas marina]MCJ9428839.1 host attachment protein [Kordiimonas marina]
MRTEMKREWIVLADRAHAKIYTRHYVDGAMQQILMLEHPEARNFQHEEGTDRPGHSHGSASHHRFAYEDHADFPEQESEIFLHAVADEINEAAQQEEMDKVILVALPKTMAVIKSGLNTHTLSKVSGEYAKNLIGVPEHTLGDRIDKLQELK